jgi:hypothetical protein
MSRIYSIPNTNASYGHHPRVALAPEAKVEAAPITLVEPEVKVPEVPVEKKPVPPVFSIAVHAPDAVVNHPPPLPTVLLPMHDVVSSLVPVQQYAGSRSVSPQPPASKEEEVVMRIKRRTGPGNVRP